MVQVFPTGFVKDGKVHGRPVGVSVDRTGALRVADDTGNMVWQVAAARAAGKALAAIDPATPHLR